MLEQIDQVRRLWRGEKESLRNALGQDVAIGTLPRPVQPELPIWVTTAGNPDTYRQAGELGRECPHSPAGSIGRRSGRKNRHLSPGTGGCRPRPGHRQG